MDWIAILVGAGCGGVGGVIGAFVGRRFRDQSSAKRVTTLIAVVLGATVGNQLATPIVREWWADIQAQTPAEKFERTFVKLTTKDPRFVAYVHSLKERGVAPDKASQESRALGARGIARLSDADLLRRAEFLSRGLRAVDEATCAQIALGVGAGLDAFRTLLNALEEQDAVAFAKIISTAVLAEIGQSPSAHPASSEQDVSRIIGVVASRASPDEIASISKVFTAGAAHHDVCSGVRALYRYLPTLPAADQPRLALILAGL